MPKSDLTQALTAIEPKTKAAKVREVMPVIEQRIAAGVIRPGFRRHSRPSLRVAPFKLYRGQVAS